MSSHTTFWRPLYSVSSQYSIDPRELEHYNFDGDTSSMGRLLEKLDTKLGVKIIEFMGEDGAPKSFDQGVAFKEIYQSPGFVRFTTRGNDLLESRGLFSYAYKSVNPHLLDDLDNMRALIRVPNMKPGGLPLLYAVSQNSHPQHRYRSRLGILYSRLISRF